MSKTLKIFTQPSCPKCPPAKILGKEIEQLKNEEVQVEYFNTGEVEGMAEGAFYQVMSTPTLLLFDDQGKVIGEWRGEVPGKKEIVTKIG